MKSKVVSLNFDRERHKKLLEWITEKALDKEMSVSGFCISILKEYYMESVDEKEKDGDNI